MDVENIVSLVKFFTVSLYTDLTAEDKLILGTSTAEILKKSPESQLTNLSHLLETLIFTAKKIKGSEIFPNFLESELYQRSLQKLDLQVRNHIKEELQLKLFSEDLAGEISNNARNEKSIKKIDDLLEKKENLLNLIRKKDIELETDQLELKLLKENEDKEGEKIKKMQKKVGNLIECCKRGKGLTESLRKEYDKDKEEFELLKKQAEGNSENGIGNKMMGWDSEVNKSCRVIRQKIKKKDISPIKVAFGRVKVTRLSQSTKGIRNPQRARTLKEGTDKFNTRTRLQMYTIKK